MSEEKTVRVSISQTHMECMLCGRELTEAFYVSVRPRMSMDGDWEKIRSMCAWATDLELCEDCMSHVMHEMETRVPGGGLLDGMITMNMGPEEMKNDRKIL